MPDKDKASPTLKQQSFKALQWNYLGSLSRAGLQFIIGIVLARLLGPEAFGLVAIASLVLGLGALFADFGLASVLIQRKEITKLDIRFVFTLQSLIGLMLTAVLELCAGSIATFFNRPDALPVLQVMFLTFAIQGLGQTSAALLRRGLDYRRLQLAQMASYLIGYLLLGLPMAIYGMGVWSLVFAQLVQAATCTAFTYSMTRHSIVPCLDNKATGFLQFGLEVTATNLSNWALVCLDSVVVGRVFGATQLGLYNRAFSLVAMPTYNIVTSLQGVLFSAASRMQDDISRVRKTYLAAVEAVGFICLPMFSVIAFIPQTMISGIYGSDWLDAVLLLTPIALAMPFSGLMGLGGPVMTGMGKAGHEMFTQFFCLLFFVPLLYWASGYTVQSLAWAVFAGYVLRFICVTHITLRLINGSWMEVVVALRGPLLVALVSTSLTYTLDSELRFADLSNFSRLLFVGGFAATITLLGVLVGQRWLFSEPISQLVRGAKTKLPLPLQKLIIV